MPVRYPKAPPMRWRHGNHFVFLNDGAEFYPRMLQVIDEANEYVLLEMYLVTSGEVANSFIEALLRAAGRGVDVRVLLDGFGALGLTAQDRKRLTDGGVQLAIYNAPRLHKRYANFLRDHRKLLLVDGRVAFVGGAGITDDFLLEGRPGTPWREVMIEIRGPVLTDWQKVFASTWVMCGGALPLPQPSSAPAIAGKMMGRVATSESWQRGDLAHSVFRRIEAARVRVWLMSAYFVPSRRFRKALRRAVRRGVDVRLLVPGPKTDHPLVRHAARRFYGKLLRNGVRIFEFQPRILHAKMVLCDDWVSIGSSNLDRWNFKWNLEANQEIGDAEFAGHVAAVFESDFRQSLELSRRHWSQRAWLDRVRERIAGMVDRWMERWPRPR